MTLNADVMFSSESDEWETPWPLIRAIEEKIGIKFRLDACAKDANAAKAPLYYSPAEDSLVQDWWGDVWMNPPYGSAIFKWTNKALEESIKGATVVSLLPARTDTKFFHELCTKGDILLLKGRVPFWHNGKPILSNKGQVVCAPFPSMVVTFRNRRGKRRIETWEVPKWR